MKQISAPEIIQEMRRRVRLYMISVALIIIVGFGGTVAGLGLLKKTMGDSFTAGPGAILFIGGILLTVGCAWIAVYKLLRCPKCDRWVVWQMSTNYSLFAGMSSRTCPGCGSELFEEKSRRRFVRILIIIMLLGFAAGFIFQWLARR